ncbi:MAG: MFS transporter [Candidatus Bathyarchaeota archaeon]|nr:MFS transporter [Candidatus Bathyarchaeota archaeon]MDW8040667.1 MFS transporter [Nitrososphaerota archaeon]
MEKHEESSKSSRELNAVYVRSVANSFGTGMVNPFVGPYAVRELGASSSEMGWIQSVSNISNNIMQFLWGRLSDRLGRRVPFIVFGGLIVALLWFPIPFLNSANQLILLIALQALLGSMATPAWTALIGDLVPQNRLGRANAKISMWASIGSLTATLASGIIMASVGGPVRQQLIVPVAIATICGLLSSIIMFKVKEKKPNNKSEKPFIADLIAALKIAKQSPDFVKYCACGATFTFFMSIAWPLFAITQAKVLGASMFEIALLHVVQGIFTIISTRWAGRLADTVGRKPLLLFVRFGYVSVPLAYAFSPSIYILIIIGAFWGVVAAFEQASVTTYLLDVTPEMHRGSFTAVYNLLIGTVTFFGSLIGGYLSDLTISLYGLVSGLQIVYLISAAGRAVGAATYFRLKETLREKGIS